MIYDYDDEPDYDLDYDDDPDMDFAEPGSGSALRAATADNPRNLPCPTCGYPNRLTPRDVQLGYQCDRCADAMEKGWEIDYYEPPEPLTGPELEKRIRGTFEDLFGLAGGVVTVNGIGTDYIRVIVAYPNNQSQEFAAQVYSDGDLDLTFWTERAVIKVSIER